MNHRKNTDTEKEEEYRNFCKEVRISEKMFKPMTKGLGFHKKKEGFKVINKSIQMLKNQNKNKVKVVDTHGTLDGLQAFYHPLQSRGEGELSLATSKEQEEEKLIVAQYLPAFMAMLIDLLMIGFILLSTVMISIKVLDLEGAFFFKREFVPYFLFLYTLFYFVYFTILDLKGTLGKNIFSLRLIDLKKNGLNASMTFLRSFLIFLSFPLLGVPLILNIHGKYSQTEIVQR